MPRVSQEKKEQIARHSAQGITSSELARLHSMTPAGIRRMLDSPEMQQLVQQEQTAALDAGSKAMYRFLSNADILADAQLTAALDPDDPNNFRARTWILERIMPQRTSSTNETNVNVTISQEVSAGLTKALEQSTQALGAAPIGHVHLVPGREALPSINTDAVAITDEDPEDNPIFEPKEPKELGG